MNSSSIKVPYWDSHFHGRLGAMHQFVMPMKAERANGGSLEPNTKNPHLTTYDTVARYVDDTYSYTNGEGTWHASIYLTSEPSIKEIGRCWEADLITHLKKYPLEGSTHSGEAASDESMLDKNSEVGKTMQFCGEAGIPVKLHAEVPVQHGKQVDPYYRERIALSTVARFRDTYPNVRIVLAHISTAEAVSFMRQYGDPDKLICEVTAHHGIADRSIVYDGGAMLSDHHCLPVIKSARHLSAIHDLISSRLPYVVAGSDSAAHLTENKYRFDAFGGLFTYHCDLELYVQLLDQLEVLDYAPAFLYCNAKRFYGDLIPDNPPPRELVQEPWTVGERWEVPEMNDKVTPFGFHPTPEKRFEFQYKLVA